MNTATVDNFLNYGVMDVDCDVRTGRKLSLEKIRKELLRLATTFKKKHNKAPTHVGLHPSVASLTVPDQEGIRVGKHTLITSVNGLLAHFKLNLVKQKQSYPQYIWVGCYRKMREAQTYVAETDANVQKEYETMYADVEEEVAVDEAPHVSKTTSFDVDAHYDESTMELTITFNSRKGKPQYTYLYVPLGVVKDFFAAGDEDGGRYYNDHIRGVYPTIALTENDPVFDSNGAYQFIRHATPEVLEAVLQQLYDLCIENGVNPTYIMLWNGNEADALREWCKSEGLDVLSGAYTSTGKVWMGVPAQARGG